MIEFCELRINNKYIDLLPKTIISKDIGSSVSIIKFIKDTIEYQQIKDIAEKIKKLNDEPFYYWSVIYRKYSKIEISNAKLLVLNINFNFEPAGEECGTIYDETTACEICGANRKQIGLLKLKKGTIPKKDINETIGGEIVVSEKFVNSVIKRNLIGFQFAPTNIEKYYQLTIEKEIELSDKTIAGINLFDLSTSSKSEVYKCPKGHTIGLNLLSSAYVLNSPLIGDNDFLVSKQKIGVNRGLLRPQPLYFCSQVVRKMVEEEKLSGCRFEVANIV